MAQTPFPDSGPVFVDTEVPRIDLFLSSSDLATLLASGNEYSDTEYSGRFIFKSSEETDTIENVGIRLRGNTSRVSQKKSFKVSFNTFVQGRKFHGLEKMNLNGEHNDPGIIRSKLSWDVLKRSGVPAPRANHVRLYINGSYKGLYINVEHVDEQLMKHRFGNNGGNLYKCLYPADLAYRGSDPNLYKQMAGSIRVYDLKTNTLADDYTDIAHLIDILNNSSLTNLPQALEPVFDVNSYLRYLAVEVLIGNWDGYSYNKNNFYLYHNQATGKFEFIPYDLDNTFGIDWFGVDWGTRNIYNWANDWEERPLTKRLMQVKTYRDRFTFFVRQILNDGFSNDTVIGEVYRLKNMIMAYAQSDPYRPLDYGWSYSDFLNSYTTALGLHVKYGLLPYISTRRDQALAQLEVVDVAPIISNATNNALSYKLPVTVSALVEDEYPTPDVILNYSVNGGVFSAVAMEKQDDGQYSATFGPFTSGCQVDYYITATDNKAQATREPLSGNVHIDLSEQAKYQLFINEVMSNNNFTVTDNYREYDDWLELYNGGTVDIWLGDKFLSNHFANPNQWAMPDTVIRAGNFMLFWADGDTLQGKMHTNFRLSKDGEELGVFNSKESGCALIDGVIFPAMQNDISYGRLPDGGSGWSLMIGPTPGESNTAEGTMLSDELPEVIVYPNPFAESVTIELSRKPKSDFTITIAHISGAIAVRQHFTVDQWQKVFTWKPADQHLAPGFYLLSVTVEKSGKRLVYLKSKKLLYMP